MKNLSLFGCLFLFLFACSDDGDSIEMPQNIADQIIGVWKLDHVKIEGSGCNSIYGEEVLEYYPADSVGCVYIKEVFGSTRCVNVDFRINGEGSFLWSDISGLDDEPITWETNEENQVRYCFPGSFCSNYFSLIDGNLESRSDASFDETNPCEVFFVLVSN